MGHFSESNTDLARIYDNAYDEALQRIDEQLLDNRKLARNVLAWITYARRQLQVEELCHALAVVHGDEDIDMDNIHDIEDVVSVCAGLVAVDEESGIVRLVHYTTQEYFERARERWLPEARVDIALTCLTYLSFSSFRSGSSENDARFEARQNKYVFLDYAARHWGSHVAEVEEAIADEACGFLQNLAAVQSATQALLIPNYRQSGYSQKYSRGTSALHLIARFGLPVIATKLYQGVLLEHVIDASNQEGVNGQTPLIIAALYGQYKVAQWLLAKCADVNARGGFFGNALQAASFKGHDQIIQLLLDKGANVNAQGGQYGNALQAALFRGHEQIVQLLLDKGADINAQSGSYSNALYAALEEGHEQIVQLLLNKGANVNARGGGFGNALHAASVKGHKQVIQLLLDKGANINAQGSSGGYGNALQAAFEVGHEQVVQLLLNKGAHAQHTEYGNALQAASVGGHEQVI